MSNFNNVTMGTGALKIGGVDVGYLKGDVNFKYNYEIEEFKTGVPRSLRGSICKEIFAELTCPLAEITADNLAQVLGGLTPSDTAAAEVNKTATFESHTFADHSPSPGVQSIKLGVTGNFPLWVTISDGADVPVIKDSTEAVTYTENDDYIVDYETGYVYRNPGGAISEGETVKVKYKYTPPASSQLNLGYSFSLSEVEVEFVHTNPTTGKDIIVHFWKANANGQAEFNFAEENWAIINFTLKAVYDSTHASNPLGYILFEE